jgi:uncharacterized protein YfiM (DUF2279 family)
MRTITYLIFILCIYSHGSFSQNRDSTYNKKKIINAGIVSSAYLISTYKSTQHFYKNYPYSPFKIKNDLNTWLGMDKAFHTYTSYQLCSGFYEANKLSNISDKKSLNIALIESLIFGITKEWSDSHIDIAGWSWYDMKANLSGNLLFYGQQRIFNEQKVKLKFSYYNSNLQANNPTVLGNSFLEYWRKDYNGQTFWLSSSFGAWKLSNKKWIKPISIALGYSGDNMLNELENSIINNNLSINRYKQYYIGLDIDWSQVEVKRKSLKVLFYILDRVKIPLPSIEITKIGTKVVLN